MSWQIICAVAPVRHACALPGRFSRWKLRLGVGSVVQCSCGESWQFNTDSTGMESVGWKRMRDGKLK